MSEQNELLLKELKDWFWDLSVGRHKVPENLSSDELAEWRAEQIIAKAKQHYEQKIKELFKEIDHWGSNNYGQVNTEGKSWQSLKDKYLGGEK